MKFAFFKELFFRHARVMGLALGSGGAKGMAHIGAIKAFEENGLKFDVVAGSSIGSIVGAFYAENYTSDEMLHLMETVNIKEISNLLMMKMDTIRLEDVINRYIGDLDFKELDKPFAAVATDLNNGERVVLTEGSVAKALCASSSYPPFFKSVSLNGRTLIDGAFSDSVPADVTRDLGANFVVGIDLAAFKRETKIGFIGGMLTNVRFDNGDTSAAGYENCDYMLRPDLGDFHATSFSHMHEMYEIGYETAKAAIPEIKAAMHKRQGGKRIKKDGEKI